VPRRSKGGARKQQRGRGRPSRANSPALTRERVLQTALKLVDKHGVESLSIRKLATELGVVPNSLYWYVRDKDDLLEGMVHLLFSNLTAPNSDAGPWTERVREVCRWYRQRLLEHPNVVETASFARMFPSAFAPLSAAIGSCLLSAGFQGEQLVRVVSTAYYHTMGFVTLEVARARFGFLSYETAREQIPALRGGGELLINTATRGLIRITSADVSDYLSLLRTQDMDALFEYGLDCLLAGLTAETPAPASVVRGQRARRALSC
jgi:TetR/AcrR family transcriptional regulator, tetracycline repressor protein